MRAAILLVLSLASVALAADQTLPAFTSVQVCTPFNVVVAPSRGNAYTLSVEADPPVVPAVSAKVSNGVLQLESKGAFRTQNPVKVVVR